VTATVPTNGARPPARRRHSAATIVPVAIVILICAFVIVVLATREPAVNRIADSPLVGRAAPPLAGQTLDGATFDIADHRGEWVLVNFFATWCGPCQREHDDLSAFHDRHAGAGDASVVSVVFDDTTEDARAFFEEEGGNWPVVVGDQGDIALDYGVIKVPESYLVSPDGVVVKKLIGGVTQEFLEELLAAAQQQTG
jgi:cytochrome c biogenesis protein CcmG/thiol:disulfide interchange protein DsbE